MTQETITLSMESKAKLFEFQKLFKASPSSITPEIRIFVDKLAEVAWKQAKDQSQPFEARTATYDIIKICHEILNRKWDDNWKPKEGKKQFTKRIITVEERIANCDAFVKYIGSRTLEDPTITVQQLALIWSGTY